jgi:SAM-dependent methyltransferase
VLLASRGAHVTGIDVSETAIRRAGEKAAQRGVVVSFRAGDILTARLPPRGFDTVIDSGLFHVFSDTDRVRYVAVLGRVLRPGGACFLMCFSDRQPGDWGPRRVARGELEAAFSDGWIIESVQPAAFDTNPAIGATTAQAWLAVIRRTEADANLRRPKRR